MRTGGFTGVDKLQVRKRGRAVATVTAALLLMLAVVLSSPRQPVQGHDAVSVGIAHEVTDTVFTDSAPSVHSDNDGVAPKQVTIAIGAVAMLAVVGVAFSRRKPHGSDRF
jgi:hypothetical protein